MSSDSPRVPLLSAIYGEYLNDQDSARFVSRVADRYAPGTLARLVDRTDRQTRRAAVLALGFLGDYDANHTMGRALCDEDRTVRMLAESGIRNLWSRAGSEADRRELGLLVRLNTAQKFREAIRQATTLIDESPWLAEAWNQRAIAHFGCGQYVECIRDSHQALEINAYHFAAASGMGQAYLKLGNHVSALECFRRALRLNPNLEGVRVQITRLSRMIEDK